MDKFYLNEETADVHFIFEDGSVKVPANKVLLAIKSKVFMAMFFGKAKENADVTMADKNVPVAAFKEFLRYFHFETVPLSIENVENFLYLGRKYLVEQCVNDCVNFFAKLLNNENACFILERGLFFDLDEMIKMCTIQISSNSSEVFQSAEFLECSPKALEHILKLNILSCSEMEVFEGAMAWVRAKCRKEKVLKSDVIEHLGDSYYQIRIASLTIAQLCLLANKFDAVLASDFVGFANMIATKCAPKDYEKFNMQPRKADWKEKIINCSFKNDNARIYRYGSAFITKIRTSEPIILGGFTCAPVGTILNGAFQRLRSLPLVDVGICDLTANDNNLMKMRIQLQSVETDILLSHPILVRPEHIYAISIGGLPDDHVFQSNALQTSMNLEPNIEISVEHPKIYSGHGIGLIQALAFNHI